MSGNPNRAYWYSPFSPHERPDLSDSAPPPCPSNSEQDYSAYFYPSLGTGGGGDGANSPGSNDNSTADGAIAGGLRSRPRQQGRLKLCSRGLLFEPADRLLPLVKYPFRHMETQMEPVGMWHGGSGNDGDPGRRGGAMTAAGVGLGGEAFRFRCKEVVESRRNDEVGNAASAISTGFALSRFVRTTAKQGRRNRPAVIVQYSTVPNKQPDDRTGSA